MNAVSVRMGGGVGGSSIDTLDQDVCPVCKTMRYLNKDLQFLINTECYHPMCSGCVDRIFNEGPNQCPYAGCHRTLRRRGFHVAYFGDLKVEREVDIRRRVGATFNKTEDEFETLDDYNTYLERVECLTNDLVNGDEDARIRADRELLDWETANRAEIERNRRAGREAETARTKKVAAEREATRRRRLDVLQEEEEERRNGLQLREEMLDGLAAADMGRDTARTVVNRIILKRRGQQRPEAPAPGAPTLSIRGLKGRSRPSGPDSSAFSDPYASLDFVPTRYTLDHLTEYSSELTDTARNREEVRVGGYCVDDYISRALFDAYSGLGVFIAEEKGVSAGLGSAVTLPTEVAAAPPAMDLDGVS